MDAALDAAAESRRALAAAVSAYDAEARAEAAAAEAAAHENRARERWEAEEAARWYRGGQNEADYVRAPGQRREARGDAP